MLVLSSLTRQLRSRASGPPLTGSLGESEWDLFHSIILILRSIFGRRLHRQLDRCSANLTTLKSCSCFFSRPPPPSIDFNLALFHTGKSSRIRSCHFNFFFVGSGCLCRFDLIGPSWSWSWELDFFLLHFLPPPFLFTYSLHFYLHIILDSF